MKLQEMKYINATEKSSKLILNTFFFLTFFPKLAFPNTSFIL